MQPHSNSSVTTVNVSIETRNELNKIKDHLQKKYFGARFSHDNVIKLGCDLLKKQEGIKDEQQ